MPDADSSPVGVRALHRDPWAAYVDGSGLEGVHPPDGWTRRLEAAMEVLGKDAGDWPFLDALHEEGIPARPAEGKSGSRLEALAKASFSDWQTLVVGLPRDGGGTLWRRCEPGEGADLQGEWVEGGRRAIWIPSKLTELRPASRAPLRVDAHLRTLSEYLRSSSPRVLGSQNFGHFEREMVRQAEQRVSSAAAEVWHPVALPYETPGYRVFADTTRLIVRDRATGETVGGVGTAVTWVSPGHRGRGIGSIVAEAGDLLGYLTPSHFSVEGYRSRLSAHRRAVERAILVGDDVPPEVLKDYVFDEKGRLERRDASWDRIAQRAADAPVQPPVTRASWDYPSAMRSRPAKGARSMRDAQADWLTPRQADIRSLKAKAQPDGISCGATAASMALDGLGLLPAGGIPAVMRTIGTNPVTGTVPWGVVEGLRSLGVHARFHGAPSDPDAAAPLRLKGLLKGATGPNFVMLRILAGGYAKHWVIAEPTGENKVRVLDPASGRTYSGTAAQLAKDWSARGYEAITISADRDQHPGLSPMSRVEPPSSGMPDPARTTLAEWLVHRSDRLVIVPIPDFGEDEARVIRNAPGELERTASDPFLRNLAVQSAARPDLHFFVVGAAGAVESMVVKDRRSGEVLGGILNGLNYVPPEHRGRGIGPEMLLVAAANARFRFLMPYSYSVEGYRTRLAAHRLAAERTLAAGGDLPAGVLSAYEQDGTGRLRLADTAWEEFAEAAEMSGRRVSRPLAGLPGMQAEEGLDEEAGLTWPVTSTPASRPVQGSPTPPDLSALDALDSVDWNALARDEGPGQAAPPLRR